MSGPGEEVREPLLIGIDEAAVLLSVSQRTVFTLTKSGEVPHVRLGRRVMYRPETLRQWVAAREQRGDVVPKQAA